LAAVAPDQTERGSIQRLSHPTIQRRGLEEFVSAAGRVQTTTLGNGDVYTFTYDTANKGRLTSVAGPDLTIAYEYDPAGNVTKRTVNGAAESFGYDAVNRLTSSGTEMFGYDQAGNRTSSNGEVWVYNARNELVDQGG